MWKLILSSILAKINLYDLLFFIFSNIRWPFVQTIDFEKTDKNLKNGDILLARRNWFLKNLIVPGRYKHVAVYFQNEALEMQNDGFQKTPINFFFSNYSEIAVYRPLDESFSEKFVAEIIKYSGVEYDEKFTLNNRSMYCSELIKVADTENYLGYLPRKHFWLLIYAPDDISRLKNLKFIARYLAD